VIKPSPSGRGNRPNAFGRPLAISLRSAASLPHSHRPPAYGHARWLPPAPLPRDGASAEMDVWRRIPHKSPGERQEFHAFPLSCTSRSVSASARRFCHGCGPRLRRRNTGRACKEIMPFRTAYGTILALADGDLQISIQAEVLWPVYPQ